MLPSLWPWARLSSVLQLSKLDDDSSSGGGCLSESAVHTVTLLQSTIICKLYANLCRVHLIDHMSWLEMLDLAKRKMIGHHCRRIPSSLLMVTSAAAHRPPLSQATPCSERHLRGTRHMAMRCDRLPDSSLID